MVEILKNINPLILDVAIVSILVLIIFFGVIKGIKKCFVDFLLFGISVFLGFCPYTNSVKQIFAKEVLHVSEWLPAGSANAHKLAASMFVSLLSALCMFLLIYVVMHVLEALIKIIAKRKRGGEKLPKSKVGRVFGGLITLVYQGAVLIVLIMCMNNNLVGINESIAKSTVTKFIVDNSEKLVVKIDENLKEKVTIKVIKGDFMYKVDEDVLDDYIYIEENVGNLFNDKNYIDVLEDAKLTNEEVYEYIEKRIVELDYVAELVNAIDTYDVCADEFSLLVEEWMTVMHRTSLTREIEKISFNMNDLGGIRDNLKKAGANDKTIALFDQITIGK